MNIFKKMALFFVLLSPLCGYGASSKVSYVCPAYTISMPGTLKQMNAKVTENQAWGLMTNGKVSGLVMIWQEPKAHQAVDHWKSFLSTFGAKKIIKDGKTKLGKNDARFCIIENTTPNKEVVRAAFYFVVNTKRDSAGYCLYCASAIKSFPALYDDFETALETFSFN